MEPIHVHPALFVSLIVLLLMLGASEMLRAMIEFQTKRTVKGQTGSRPIQSEDVTKPTSLGASTDEAQMRD